jgi:hypothetical protein
MTAGALLATGVMCAAVLAAPTAPAGGQIFIHATGGQGPTGTIVIVGAIGDHGTTLTVDKNGKPDSNGTFVKVTLQKGTFEVDSTAFAAKTSKVTPMINKRTCSFMWTASGPMTVFNGTGLYKGIKGTVTITQAFGGVGPVYASGPNKGQCIMSHNAKPLAQFGTITGPGTVTFH